MARVERSIADQTFKDGTGWQAWLVYDDVTLQCGGMRVRNTSPHRVTVEYEVSGEGPQTDRPQKNSDRDLVFATPRAVTLGELDLDRGRPLTVAGLLFYKFSVQYARSRQR